MNKSNRRYDCVPKIHVIRPERYCDILYLSGTVPQGSAVKHDAWPMCKGSLHFPVDVPKLICRLALVQKGD